jgi:hypothetical protein
MGTPADFRNYAQQCVELARKTRNQTLRETLLEMAETWLGLAGASQIEFEHLRGNGFATDATGPGPGPDAA